MIRRKRPGITNKFLFFIGLALLMGGLSTAYLSFGKMSYRYVQTLNWNPVQVQIENLELVRNYGDNTTYNIDARYSYVIDGQTYVGTAVALSNINDNIGSFWQDLYRELKRKRNRNEVYAYVDPNDPQKAVLNRSFRWELVIFSLIFIGAFGIFGGAMVWAGTRPIKSKSETIRDAKSGIASNEVGNSWLMFGVGAIFFIFGALISILVLPEALRDGNYLALLVLIFAAVGGGIMYFAWTQKRLQERIGSTPIFLDPLPGNIGGQVGGHFDMDAIPHDIPLEMVLTCSRYQGSGDNRKKVIHWQTTQVPYVKRNVDGARVMFVFDVPDHLPVPSEKSSSVDWEISCSGPILMRRSALRLSRTWDIPLEKGHAKSRLSRYIPETFVTERKAQEREDAWVSALQQIDLHPMGDTYSMISKPLRHLGFSLFCFAFGLVFGGVGIALRTEWWPAYIFLAIGLIALFCALFTLGRKIVVVINPRDQVLFMGRSWFRMPIYTKELRYSNDTTLSVSETMSSSSGKKQTKYFALYANDTGKKIKLAEAIEGEDAANALLDKVRAILFG